MVVQLQLHFPTTATDCRTGLSAERLAGRSPIPGPREGVQRPLPTDRHRCHGAAVVRPRSRIFPRQNPATPAAPPLGGHFDKLGNATSTPRRPTGVCCFRSIRSGIWGRRGPQCVPPAFAWTNVQILIPSYSETYVDSGRFVRHRRGHHVLRGTLPA